MPIIVRSDTRLPIKEELKAERVHVIDHTRAQTQDIRPLKIGLLNLMPAAVLQSTELQFFRLIGNTPLQIEPVLIKFNDFKRNKGAGRLDQFYLPFDAVKKTNLDALIITGANLELNNDKSDFLNFKEIDYYEELSDLVHWARENLTSTIYSCFAAHFALKQFYDLDRDPLTEKTFGVYDYQLKPRRYEHFLRGLNDDVPCPHSRWGNIALDKIREVRSLKLVLASNNDWLLATGRRGKEIYIQGHPEYDRYDLAEEYQRDRKEGQKIPDNYFPNDNPNLKPYCNWKADASVLYRNWVDYVYQHANFSA